MSASSCSLRVFLRHRCPSIRVLPCYDRRQSIASCPCRFAIDSSAELAYCPRPMPRPRYALNLLFAVAMFGAALGQAPLAPETGVLVLRNGQVLEGEVTRAGDYYIVTKGEGSEVRLKTDDVELFSASLLEAYEFKARHLSGISAKPHLVLAE